MTPDQAARWFFVLGCIGVPAVGCAFFTGVAIYSAIKDMRK